MCFYLFYSTKNILIYNKDLENFKQKYRWVENTLQSTLIELDISYFIYNYRQIMIRKISVTNGTDSKTIKRTELIK